VIYFMMGEITRLIKIGYCLDFRTFKVRLYNFKANSPERLWVLGTIEDGDEDMEESLHKKFQSVNNHNEWFDESTELLRFIFESRDCSPYERLNL